MKKKNKILHPLTRGITRKITRGKIDCFLKKHATKKKVLDIGTLNPTYGDSFPNRTCLNIVKNKDIDLRGDAHRLPFKDACFDVVIILEVLEHLQEPKTAISEINRVLRPEGKLLLTTRFVFPLHDTPGHFYRYTKYGLKYLLTDWDNVVIKEEANTVETISILLQRIAIQCDILKFMPFKILLHCVAKIIRPFGFIITKEYGGLGKDRPEKNIMTSGYYVVANKKIV